MALNYSTAARIAHLVAARNQALESLRLAPSHPRVREAIEVLQAEPRPGSPGGAARSEPPPFPERPSGSLLDGLADRQKEVAMLVAKGWTNKQIGTELGLSPLTVKRHLRIVFQKTSCQRRSQLAALLA